MHHIFISYARTDVDKAALLAKILEGHGWSVWWDHKIRTGETFDKRIEEALDSAKCVVVLWSARSVSSDWVKSEAAEAAARRVLLPVLIEPVKIPLEFRRFQTADLSRWDAEAPHKELDKLLGAIAAVLGAPAMVEKAKVTSVETGEPPLPARQPHAYADRTLLSPSWRTLKWLAGAAAVAMLLAGVYQTINPREGTPLDPALESKLEQTRNRWVDRIFLAQAKSGGIGSHASKSSAPTQVWTTAQSMMGVLATQEGARKRGPNVRAALEYIENARRSRPEEGWGLYETAETTITEIAAWVTLAHIASIEAKPAIWEESERPRILERIRRDLEHILERQDSRDGGFRPVGESGPEFTRTYSTVMAVWSLIEAKRSQTVSELIGSRLDDEIIRGIRWLLAHYDKNVGWVPNPHRSADERFDGLTAQTLFVLSRAESVFGFLEKDIRYVTAQANFAVSKDLARRSVKSNDRIPDGDSALHSATKTYQLEGSTFLWFPWSLLALTHLSNDASIGNKQQAAARLRREILNANIDHLDSYVDAQFMYVMAEHLFGLSASFH